MEILAALVASVQEGEFASTVRGDSCRCFFQSIGYARIIGFRGDDGVGRVCSMGIGCWLFTSLEH